MRRILFVATAFAAGLLGAIAAPSQASAVLPAPTCESGDLQFFCDASSSGATEWNIIFRYPGNPVTMTFTTPDQRLLGGCDSQVMVDASYTYAGQGSAVGRFLCRSGPWQ